MKTDLGLLILRLGVGGMILFGHGWGKLVGFSVISQRFPDPLGLGSTVSLSLAVFAEFFCAIAVMMGLLTRLAVIPLCITMFVAAGIIHGLDPWSKKEMALLYAVPFLVLFFTGPGRFSLDRMLGKRNMS